jgi:hypothetical protein
VEEPDGEGTELTFVPVQEAHGFGEPTTLVDGAAKDDGVVRCDCLDGPDLVNVDGESCGAEFDADGGGDTGGGAPSWLRR